MPILAFFNVGPTEMVVLAIVAVLLFGKRLPEVGRSLGKGIVEFKKGLQGIEDDLHAAVRHNPEPWRDSEQNERPALRNTTAYVPPATESKSESPPASPPPEPPAAS